MRLFRRFARSEHSKRLAVILLLLPLAACTTPRAGTLTVAETDRWEQGNRKIYKFNKGIDKYALRPTAQVYRAIVPVPGRHAISNLFNTYNQPLTFVNAVMQGKIKQAFHTVDRFLINVTLGVGGIADPATELGRPDQPEDWGQTFAQWGIQSGPYVMLPLFGPSTLRDSFGLLFDFGLHPSDFIRNAAAHPSLFWKAGQISTRIVNLRSRIEDAGGDAVLAGSLDEYTLVKSAYLQTRLNDIWDGNPPYVPEDDGSGDVPAAPAATPSPATPAPTTPPGATPPAATPATAPPTASPPPK